MELQSVISVAMRIQCTSPNAEYSSTAIQPVTKGPATETIAHCLWFN